MQPRHRSTRRACLDSIQASPAGSSSPSRISATDGNLLSQHLHLSHPGGYDGGPCRHVPVLGHGHVDAVEHIPNLLACVHQGAACCFSCLDLRNKPPSRWRYHSRRPAAGPSWLWTHRVWTHRAQLAAETRACQGIWARQAGQPQATVPLAPPHPAPHLTPLSPCGRTAAARRPPAGGGGTAGRLTRQNNIGTRSARRSRCLSGCLKGLGRDTNLLDSHDALLIERTHGHEHLQRRRAAARVSHSKAHCLITFIGRDHE
jgi:hypothetical protein